MRSRVAQGRRAAGWSLALGLLGCLGSGCRSEPETQLVTRVQALSVAPPADSPPLTPCSDAERQAEELGKSLPKQLDADTRATRVTARGCDLILEYELSTLSASEVAPGGVAAMRERVVEQLCADRGAQAVLQRGGTFTNVYYDRVHAPVGRFSVAAEDCEG
jgi:hypothetical protein